MYIFPFFDDNLSKYQSNLVCALVLWSRVLSFHIFIGTLKECLKSKNRSVLLKISEEDVKRQS